MRPKNNLYPPSIPSQYPRSHMHCKTVTIYSTDIWISNARQHQIKLCLPLSSQLPYYIVHGGWKMKVVELSENSAGNSVYAAEFQIFKKFHCVSTKFHRIFLDLQKNVGIARV
jgi:hypothetical protein